MASVDLVSPGRDRPRHESDDDATGESHGHGNDESTPRTGEKKHDPAYKQETADERESKHVIIEQWRRFRWTTTAECRTVTDGDGQKCDPDTDHDGGDSQNDTYTGEDALAVHYRTGCGSRTASHISSPGTAGVFLVPKSLTIDSVGLAGPRTRRIVATAPTP